jgi:hypothetical protein
MYESFVEIIMHINMLLIYDLVRDSINDQIFYVISPMIYPKNQHVY